MQLDKSQQRIVDSSASKICVIAGAGSGKTTTLTERVRKVLNDGANPHNVVCITFTKMAAQEMRERLKNVPSANGIFIGTMHSYAYKLLKSTGKAIQLLTPEKEREFISYLIQKYARYIDEETYEAWKSCKRLQELGYRTKDEVNSLLSSEARRELNILLDDPNMSDFYESLNSRNANTYREALEYQTAAHTSQAYPETVRSLAAKHNYITFDELLLLAKKHSVQIDYLFVDEFQDVGVFEYKFLMGLNAKNVFVVGDDYQCQPSYTKVLKSNGQYCNISDIQVGDKVISYNLHTQQLCEQPVIAVQESLCSHLIEIRSKSGHVSYYTPNHKCIVKTVSGIDTVIRADCINISHRLITYDAAQHKLHSSQITSIKYVKQPEDIKVYSLEISDNHTYIADRIVTHNSIYKFKGSDFEYFKKLANSSKFNTYKLAANYRSNTNIVNYSNNIISNIDTVIPKRCVSKVKNPLPGKIIEERGGLSVVRKYAEAINKNQLGKWFIITRSNNDLVRISRMLYAMGIPSDTFKVSGITSEEHRDLMAKNSIKVLTVHTAKGLEADNVIMYGKFPSPKNPESCRSYWKNKGDEECRIMYVAATRAKRNLIVVNKSDTEK